MGKAPGISLSLRRAFDGGILAIVGVKSMAAIGVRNKYKGRIAMMGLPITNTGQTVTVATVLSTLSTSNMADAASGSADKSVQVKLVLLGAPSELLINLLGS